MAPQPDGQLFNYQVTPDFALVNGGQTFVVPAGWNYLAIKHTGPAGIVTFVNKHGQSIDLQPGQQFTFPYTGRSRSEIEVRATSQAMAQLIWE